MSTHHSHTWPRLEDREHLIACHFCDAQHKVDLIEEGEKAICGECGQVLYRNRRHSLSRAVAYGVTALCLMMMAMLFPFITMDAFGNMGTVSVPGAVASLWAAGGGAISICIALFVIGLPFLLVSSLLYLCIPLMKGRALPFAPKVMCWFQALRPWVMVEVFFLGAMISLLKLVKLADVTLGIGFWAVAGLMLCMAGAVSGIDKVELWDRLELAVKRGKK